MLNDFGKKFLLLLGISIIGLLVNIDYTAVNLALVSIAKEMHAKLDVMQWILSGYVLAWAAIVIPAGKWADNFSLRSVCVFGLSLFIISSVFAGLSTTPWMLIASRVLQGISGAISMPTLYSLIFSNFSEKDRGKAIGIFSLGVGTGAAIGPSVGGLFLKTIGWSWIFYINVPLTLLSLICILFSTTKDSVKKNDKQAFQTNALILGFGIIALMYSINQLNHFDLFSPMVLGLFSCAAILIFFFYSKEKSSKNPTIPQSLIVNKHYRGVTLAFALEQFCFSSTFVALGLYMQNVLSYSAYYASIVFLALSFIFALISTFSGIILNKTGVNRPALLGFIFLALGCYLFLLLPEQMTTSQLVSVLLILGTGMGLAFSSLNTGMMSTVKEQEIGIASSIFIMCALIGNALGVVITTLVTLAYGISVAFNVAGLSSLLGAGLLVKMMYDGVKSGQKTTQLG